MLCAAYFGQWIRNNDTEGSIPIKESVSQGFSWIRNNDTEGSLPIKESVSQGFPWIRNNDTDGSIPIKAYFQSFLKDHWWR